MAQPRADIVNAAWKLVIEQGFSRRTAAAKLGISESRIDRILNALHARRKRGAPPMRPRAGTPRIVLLEDDPFAADMLEHMLASSGVEALVVHALDRPGYLRALESGDVDAVISDSSVPGIKPLKAFHLVKQRHPTVAFFILSARKDDMRARLASRAGVAAYIEKKFMGQLIPLVREAVDLRASPPRGTRKGRTPQSGNQ